LVSLPINYIFSVQEEEQWLFLSRKTSLRKRSLKYLVDEAHCLWSDAIHHNITGQSNRITSLYYEKTYLEFLEENFRNSGILKVALSQVWWCTPLISALGRRRQANF
jgi:hypothetical protein